MHIQEQINSCILKPCLNQIVPEVIFLYKISLINTKDLNKKQTK